MISRFLLACFALLALLGLACGSGSPPPQARAADEAAIRALIADLDSNLTAGTSEAWSAHFTEDADYTAWTGDHHAGRGAIRDLHAQLLGPMYSGTKQRYEVQGIRFLRDDVAVVHLRASVVPEGQELPSEPMAAPVLVLTKEGSEWRVAVYHNLLLPRAAQELICDEPAS